MSQLTVKLADGTEHVVVTTPGDMVRYEHHAGVSVGSLASEEASQSMDAMCFLAYAGLKRKGIFHGTWEEFLDQVEGFGEEGPKAAG